MLLSNVLKDLKEVKNLEFKKFNPDIKGIHFNSQRILKDFIFVAITGDNNDGHKYIDEAIKKVEKKLKTAATGTETGPVIAEGLHGPTALGKQLAERGWKISKEATTKPAWWQAMIPNVLRVGGQPYKGAYPAGVSAERVGATTGGLLFAGATIPSLAESMTKKHLAKKDILSVEQIMSAAGDTYGEAYNPNAMIDKLESGDVILPERIE